MFVTPEATFATFIKLFIIQSGATNALRANPSAIRTLNADKTSRIIIGIYFLMIYLNSGNAGYMSCIAKGIV